MRLSGQTISHIQTITHDSKVLVIGTAPSGEIYYAVKRSGFEESALADDALPFGFEAWKALRLGESADDVSVVEHERVALTDAGGAPILRSLYGAGSETTKSADAPVQLISALGHLYVFRQSPTGKVVVSRFVLDGMTNELIPRLEVRFRRSRRRLTPDPKMTKKGNALENVDSVDYRDMDNKPFYEPATELSFLGSVSNGWFTVALLATTEDSVSRWHFVVYDATARKLVAYSVLASESGLFDVCDSVYGAPGSDGALTYRPIAGILKRTLDIQGVTVVGAPVMTSYDLQYEQVSDDGAAHLMRDVTRLMLAVPVKRAGDQETKVVALSFGLAGDGTWAQVDQGVDSTEILRSKKRDLLLPLDTLDEIKEFATQNPPASGKILACERGKDDNLQIRSQGALTGAIAAGASVRLRGTQSYDGPYTVTAVDGNRFTVAAAFVNNEPGFWEEVPAKQTGLVFDDMIVGYQKSADGKLEVLCSAHDLKAGDQVQISGTRAYDGVSQVLSVDAATNAFVLDMPYFPAEVANLSTLRRRGLIMNGTTDKVVTPSLGIGIARRGRPWARTLQTWVRVDAAGHTERKLIADSAGVTRLLLDASGKGCFEVSMADGTVKSVKDPTVIPVNAWVHYAATIRYDPAANASTLTLMRDGVEVATLSAPASFPRTTDGPAHLDGPPLTFDGPADYVSLPGMMLDPSTGMTVEMWFRSDYAFPGTFLVDLGNGPGQDNISVTLDGFDVKLSALVVNGVTAGNTVFFEDMELSLPDWMHVAVTLSASGEVTIYKNGAAVATGTTAAPRLCARKLNYLGQSTGLLDEGFRGAMADVRLWSRIRTAEEIAANRQTRLRGNEPGLIAWWPLDDGTGRPQGGRYLATVARPPVLDAYTLGEAFQGELAEVQIWTVARTAAEIKSTMNQAATGKEEGLAAYYRLSALVYDDPKTAPDFAAGRHDAVVYGEPYTGARRLMRATSSGIKVVKYGNSALVAVSQHATYEETFEFKVNAGSSPVDVNNADGTGRKLFALQYWGKRGRNSDTQIPFPAGSFQQQDFKSLDGGWYSVTCRFTVPDGVTMMRAFEMGDVRGRWEQDPTPPAAEWTSIEVRGHHIRQLSDAVTREVYTDTLAPQPLSASAPSLAAVLSAESDVQAKRTEMRDLLQRLDVARNASRYRIEKEQLETKVIPALNQEKATLAVQIKDIQNAWESYYYTMAPYDGRYGVVVQPRYGSAAEHTYLAIGSDSSEAYQQWSFELAPDDNVLWRIRNRASGLLLELADTYVGRGTDIWLARPSGAAQQRWIVHFDGISEAEHMVCFVRTHVDRSSSNYCWNVWGAGHAENTLIKMHARENTGNMRFTFRRGEMLKDKADQIKADNSRIDEILALLSVRCQRVTELNALLALSDSEAAVKDLIRKARTDLDNATATSSTLANVNRAYLGALAALPPLAMPELKADSRGLTTQGAVLDFVQPSGPVSIADTCDGNVVLSYVDSRGRLCQTAYDATADSRNTSYEQWLPPPGRAAASFGGKRALTLAAPVPLPQGEATFEVWFQYPLPFKDDGTYQSYYDLHAFASDADGENIPLAVAGGDRLGLVAEGMFHDSGARLSNHIAAGWHHAAVTMHASMAEFYLDGIKVGTAKRTFRALHLNGRTDYLSVPAFDWPTKAFTVSIWARSTTPTWNESGMLMCKRTSFILHPDKGTRTVRFFAYGTVNKTLEFTPDDIQGWHLYTATFDGSSLCLYFDGKLCASDLASGEVEASSSTALTIGFDPTSPARLLNGQIAEPCIWNVALSAPEIDDLLRQPVKPDMPGLIGAWDMSGEGATIKDLTSQKRDGEMKGSRQVVDVKPICQGSVTLNAFALGGNGDYLSVPAFPWPTSAFTVSVWAKSTTPTWSNHGVLMCKRGSFILHPQKDSRTLKLYGYARGEEKSIECTPEDIQGWHLYTGTYDGSSLRLYIDGKLCAQGAMSGAVGATEGVALTIGYDPNGSRYLNGQIREPGIWNRALTEQEVNELFQYPIRLDMPGLIGAWKVEEGNLARDLSAEARNATVMGTPRVVLAKVVEKALTHVGNTPSGTSPVGRIAEMKLWHGALTDDEIAANARCETTGNEPGLQHYWPLSEGTGAVGRDHAAEDQVHGSMDSDAWLAATLPIGGTVTRALTFDGRSAYVEVPSALLPSASTSLTVSCFACCTGNRGARRTVVSLWGFSLTMESNNQWSAQVRTGASAQDGVSATGTAMGDWVHLAATYDGTTVTLYVNGVSAGSKSVPFAASTAVPLRIGASSAPTATEYLAGQVAMVSVFNQSLSAAEVANLQRPLRGDEAGLFAYWPLDEAYTPGMKARDLGPHGLSATVQNAWPVTTYELPINKGAAATIGEYSTVSVDPEGQNTAIMRRFFALAGSGDVEVVPDQRVEELTLQWIGNMQLNPTLLGYIEGAPPMPSENFTVQEEREYQGATSITLEQSDDVSYLWDRSEDEEISVDMSGFLGAGFEEYAGIALENEIAAGEVGGEATYAHRKRGSHQSKVSASSSLQMSDSLSLRGRYETKPLFPRLGKRFLPKNVGYALVISGMADVFISRLKRTGRMVSQETRPVEGVPLDINTITFMINPAYTLNGTLDGQVGSAAADTRFYGHVPGMRAKYGALYPASYYRLKEAYELKRSIEAQDRSRESYFMNYSVSDTGYDDIPEQSTPQLALPDVAVPAPGDDKAAAANAADAVANAREDKEAQEAEGKARKEEIERKYASITARARANSAFDDWQRRMERLQIRAGKRNIVNTYVWDGDGGLRTESESFASTIEHSVAGGMSDGGGAGPSTDMLTAGVKWKFKLISGRNLGHDQSKTMSSGKTMQLNVSLSGVERSGITDLDDRPLVPGEKVDRYRFMTFFLEGSVDHFYTFFNEVVDPEWLASNDEEARALRQTQSGRPNQCWRVLHRVTYVERPALLQK